MYASSSDCMIVTICRNCPTSIHTSKLEYILIWHCRWSTVMSYMAKTVPKRHWLMRPMQAVLTKFWF